MKIYTAVSQLVGRTPLLKLSYVQEATVLAKLELFNPAGSAKDRVALQMIKDALERGDITQDTTIIEPTSGNTGIGLAAIAAYKGYKVILTMPDTMSIERRKLLAAYGAKIVLTDGSLGMKGAIDEAEKILKRLYTSFCEVAKSDTSGPLMRNTQQVYAGMTYGRTTLNESYMEDSHRGFFV